MPIFWCGTLIISPSSNSVDFPQPEPPITATISLSATSNETPPSA
jgi:hypothetical protein